MCFTVVTVFTQYLRSVHKVHFFIYTALIRGCDLKLAPNGRRGKGLHLTELLKQLLSAVQITAGCITPDAIASLAQPDKHPEPAHIITGEFKSCASMRNVIHVGISCWIKSTQEYRV